MKIDIKRVMSRVKKRAVPANGDAIRMSGYWGINTQTCNCNKECNSSENKCSSHAKARKQYKSNEASGGVMGRSEGLLATLIGI